MAGRFRGIRSVASQAVDTRTLSEIKADLKQSIKDTKATKDKDVPELSHLTTGLSAYESYKVCVYWYFPGHVMRLRVVLKQQGRAGVWQVAAKCDEFANQFPLHMVDNEFTIDNYQWKMTGRSVVSCMLACLWVLSDEDPVIMGGAMNDWPDLPLYANLSLPGLELAKRYPVPEIVK